ncbi:DUF6377 domain-containing protein [Bacteroides gallinaceum]|uniref:DUF6377 domain-containing protein n=1 Tax=Bacteroides gallinaceum TaxID=1462571 RepID=UPI0025A4C76A|nr:DUF6377 domain-containing protein [Bacteroides gallinaceum]MDM8155525.1 DUF6377 domain-containing protein [Bacteroides gallinaceum]
MKKTIILIVLSHVLAFACMGQSSNERILKELDEVIGKKKEHCEERERTIAQLKQRLANEYDNAQRYTICSELFTQYLHYQADSALHYVDEMERYVGSAKPQRAEADVIINRADAMGVMGAYNEALQTLEQIDRNLVTPDVRLKYYYAMRTYYGWMADYTIILSEKEKYIRKTACYRDSVLMLVPEGPGRSISLAEKMLLESQFDAAIPVLNKTLSAPMSMQEKAYVNYTLASVYEAKGDVEMQIYYLAQTAIIDLTMAVREYASLQRLAWVLYRQGDIERAYRYLRCSMEDAVACNARLRFLEVTEIFPIVNKAYSERIEHEMRLKNILFLTFVVIAVLLIVVALRLYSWNKKLSQMRVGLSLANEELKSVNDTLAQTGKIKEVYIANYLDRCVSYLDKLEQYRRSLEKLAMASRIEDLFKAIRSDQFLRDERKEFYTEFDKSFLELFPHFIDDFNCLLEEDAQICPKKGELLNTELRIFALIRLGVTDTARIAHFLGYSLATVYNYRSRIRNKVKGDKETFEQEVMKL